MIQLCIPSGISNKQSLHQIGNVASPVSWFWYQRGDFDRPFDSIFSIYVLLHRFANLTICSPGLTDALVTCPPRFLKVDGWGCVGAGWWACRYIFTLFLLFLFLPGLLAVLRLLLCLRLCVFPSSCFCLGGYGSCLDVTIFPLCVCEMSTFESQGSFVTDAPRTPCTTLGHLTLKPFGPYWLLITNLGAPTSQPTHTDHLGRTPRRA